MKTAMQELFDEMTSVNWHLYSYEDKIKIINIHFEKEKEQIIRTARVCHFEGVRQSAKTSEEYIKYGEEYYNQTYNQNK